MSKASLSKLGDAAFERTDKVSAELLALTYGSFVRQLLIDYEDAEEVNAQLARMGYNIGVRLVDDFLAKSKAPPCASFADTADVVAKVAFKMFLGVPALVGSWSSDRRTFSLVFSDNPLAEFTELPEKWGEVWYSNVLCGVIKGALEMVQMEVDARFVRCTLRGEDLNEIRVTLLQVLQENAVPVPATRPPWRPPSAAAG